MMYQQFPGIVTANTIRACTHHLEATVRACNVVRGAQHNAGRCSTQNNGLESKTEL